MSISRFSSSQPPRIPNLTPSTAAPKFSSRTVGSPTDQIMFGFWGKKKPEPVEVEPLAEKKPEPLPADGPALAQTREMRENFFIPADKKLVDGFRIGNPVDFNAAPVVEVNRQTDEYLAGIINQLKEKHRTLEHPSDEEKLKTLIGVMREVLEKNRFLFPDDYSDSREQAVYPPAGAVVPLGEIFQNQRATDKHCAVLFKVLADEIDLPASLCHGTYKGDGKGISVRYWNQISEIDFDPKKLRLRREVELQRQLVSEAQEPLRVDFLNQVEQMKKQLVDEQLEQFKQDVWSTAGQEPDNEAIETEQARLKEEIDTEFALEDFFPDYNTEDYQKYHEAYQRLEQLERELNDHLALNSLEVLELEAHEAQKYSIGLEARTGMFNTADRPAKKAQPEE